jgi:hypothetical protein
MTRHKIINPKTGRKVFKTGALGKKIAQQNKKEKRTKCKGALCHKHTTNKKKGGPVKGKNYAKPGASPTVAIFKPCGKTKGGGLRPSARAMLNAGYTGRVWYAGQWHYMHFDSRKRPTYKVCKKI